MRRIPENPRSGFVRDPYYRRTRNFSTDLSMKDLNMNEQDPLRLRAAETVDPDPTPSRAGAGNASSRVFRREARPEANGRPAGSLPFMDLAIQNAAIQRKESSPSAVDVSTADATSIATRGLSGATSSLPHAAKMQSAFEGTLDLSTVNVHRGPEAADASSKLGAQAYALGSNIALPDGADEFTTAHELAHVAQGQRGKVQPRGVSSPDDAEERQADAVAARVVAGQPIGELLGSPLQSAPATASAGAVMRRGATEGELHGPASDGFGQITQPGAVNAAAIALAKTRASMEAILRDARAKRRPLNILFAEALGLLSGVHQQIGSLATHSPPEGSLPFDDAVRQLDGLYAAAWQLHELAGGVQPPLPLADVLWQEILRVALSGTRIGWKAPASIGEITERQRAEVACEPGSEDDHTRRPACALDDRTRIDYQGQARAGLMTAGTIFFDECDKQASALKAAIARDQAIWGAIAGAAANTILAVLSGGVGLAAGGLASGSAVGVGASAGAGGFAEGRAVGMIVADAAKSVPVASSEFATAIREMGNKVARDIGKELLRNRTREAARSSQGGRSDDERQQTIDSLDMLKQAFLTQLARVAATTRGLTDEQLIELKSALLDTATLHAQAAQFVAKFVSDFRSELEPIGTVDYGSGLGAPPERLIPGVVRHRAIYIKGVGGKTRLALVRHVSDTFPAIRHAGRAAVDGMARGIDEVTEGDTYDEQAWKNYRDDPGDEFHFERWIKNEHFQEIAGRDAPTIAASRVQGLSFADMLGAEEK